MPLSRAAANDLVGAINADFSGIGASDETAMPASKRNTEPVAYEYYLASHLLRLAEARKKNAIKAAYREHVLFDPEKSPLPTGTHALVYAGDMVEIDVDVGTPATRLDLDGFLTDLETHRVKRDLLKRLVTKHTKDNRAPHKFNATLATV